MSRELFPNEIIQSTTQYHFWKHTVRSQLLYTTVLLFFAFSLFALPFLYVDISVKSSGILRPISKMKELTSPVSGRIVQLEAKENSTLSKGTLIVRMESSLLEEQLTFVRRIGSELNQHIHDLELLVSMDSSSVFRATPTFKTPLFRRSFLTFREELQNSIMEMDHAYELYDQQQYLYKNDAISYSKLKESEVAFKTIRKQYDILFEKRLGEWEAELRQYRQKRDDRIIEEQQLEEELYQYKIFMPINGTIQNLAPISEGSYVYTGQQLAKISPDTGLIAECYVASGDIGLLREGMEVHFQVDAFEYNHWGILKGGILDISEDAVIIENRPLFIVRTELDQTYLELPNGYRGYVKKGMTLQARFMITRRSLFQLLFKNIDDRFNPNWD